MSYDLVIDAGGLGLVAGWSTCECAPIGARSTWPSGLGLTICWGATTVQDSIEPGRLRAPARA